MMMRKKVRGKSHPEAKKKPRKGLSSFTYRLLLGEAAHGCYP